MSTLAGLHYLSMRIAPLATALAAAAVLTACGGGGGDAPMSVALNPPGQGIAVGEPNPSALVNQNVFINMAQGASCSDVRNRLYIIDQKQVFWDVAGKCADASYSYTLFGPTPELKQCSSADSIAGPRTSCADERYRSMFDTIVKNRDKADLGLGDAHKIEVVDLTPPLKLGNTVPFEPLVVNQYSLNSEVKNLVVRDAREWSVLWKQLYANHTEVPQEAWVDFSQKMVLAVFRGNASNGCAGVGVVRTSVLDGALRVEYADAPAPGPDVICLAVITSPVAVVVVDKFEQVSFEQIKPTPVKLSRLDAALRTDETTPPFTVTIKDELQWQKLWNQHVYPATPMPKIDFSTQMVLFAWGGRHSSGCDTSRFTSVSRAGGKLYASVLSRMPGPTISCIEMVTASGEFVVVDRSDDPVVFAHSTMPY